MSPDTPQPGNRHGGQPRLQVQADRLSKHFGKFVAVDEVSFAIPAGEVFGFLGPNGAGKTTTIKMLAGLLVPTSGRGSVAGFDIAREPEAIKRRIGYMSQLFSLYADLTVEENISFFSGLYDVPRARRNERRAWVLEMAGLKDMGRRLTSELSLGWKQRLALGCAVLHEPSILFLDEPTSGVDPLSRRSFWDLIYALAGEGTTVLVSTHYMEEAEYCHRLALISAGRLIALDTPAGMKNAIRTPLFEIQAEESAKAAEVLVALPGIGEVGMFGRALHVSLEDAQEQDAEAHLRAWLEDRGVRVSSIARISPSLEDVFVMRVHEEQMRRQPASWLARSE